MSRTLIVALFSFLICNLAFSQNLLKERIRKIDGRKKSIYHERGIFSNKGKRVESVLKGIRHSYSPKQGFERIVIDFDTSQPPKVYSYLAGKEKKLYLDLFNTKAGRSLGSFGNSKFVKVIDVFPLDGSSLSMELTFKKNSMIEMFSLKSPGRLVIDVKI